MTGKQKFSAQASPELLQALHDLIDKRNRSQPRRHVIDLYRSSLDKYDQLYRRLAE